MTLGLMTAAPVTAQEVCELNGTSTRPGATSGGIGRLARSLGRNHSR